jgi:hypothetical protein
LGILTHVYPVQAPVEKLPGAIEQAAFNLEALVYTTDAFQLPRMVELGETGIIRGHRYVELLIYPLDVNPVTREARVVSSISLRIVLTGSDMELTRAKQSRYGSFAFQNLTDRLLVTTSVDRSLDELNGLPEPPMLLIITDPLWVNNANLLNFVQWKKDKGFRPLLVTTGQTGTTNTLIKAYIQNAYDNAPLPPTYVLLIGDVSAIPAWTGIGSDNPLTDLNYTMLEGTDYMPDIDIGRWAIADLTDLTNILAKTMQYEQVGWSGNNTWEKYCCFMASSDNYTVSEGTHNFVISNYLSPDGYSYDRLYCHTYSATPAQVTAAHNAGRSLSIYSGHGAETYWADGPVFYQSDVNALVNTVYPFVQSYACITGTFSVAECFAETWIRATHGAIGIMASSVNSYWTEDDILEKRVMEGYCANVTPTDENQTWMAGMMNYGKVRYYAYFGNTSTTRRYFEMYNIFGDPSIDLWTAVPVQLTTSHAPALFVGVTTFDVTVGGISDWALICAHDENNEIYASQYLFANGTATLNLGTGATTPGNLHITVTGHDCVPYQATIPITVQNGPYLVTSSEVISDATGGDGDGLADYGETLDVTLTEENLGNEAANNVTVSLVSTDDDLLITDNIEFYGSVPAQQQVTIPNGYEMSLSPNVADGKAVRVDITATDDAQHTWNDWFSVTAHAPRVTISATAVNDATGNNNGVMDAGETVLLTLTLFNGGSVGASSLIGTLSTDYAFATITQNTGTLAALNTGQTGSLTPFTVVLSPSAPGMDRAFFYLSLAMAGGRTEQMMVEMTIGGFSDAIENGQGSWTHQANQAGWNDQWHISTETSHSPTHAWKCGDAGTGNYANHMDAVLVTPAINLTGHAELRFWHQMDGEISTTYSDSAYDGSIIEISANGGAWTQLIPTTGGYNKWIRCTAGGGNPYTGPFACRTRCFSGTISWSEVVCDLGAFSGSAQIRFRFGSDNGGQREGWYVDDVRLILVVGNNPPWNLQADLAGPIAHLSWESPSSGAIMATLRGYTVYRNGSQIDSLIQALEYFDNLASEPYGIYTYEVAALYSNGESAHSNPAAVDWNATAPDSITDMTIRAMGNDLILRWSQITGANEYHVYSSDSPDSFEGSPIVVTQPTCTLVGEAANFERRFYMVRAVRN